MPEPRIGACAVGDPTHRHDPRRGHGLTITTIQITTLHWRRIGPRETTIPTTTLRSPGLGRVWVGGGARRDAPALGGAGDGRRGHRRTAARRGAGAGGESFLRVDWDAVPEAMRARRLNNTAVWRRRRRGWRTCRRWWRTTRWRGVGARRAPPCATAAPPSARRCFRAVRRPLLSCWRPL
eukprot:SAG25_NODE_33_length_20262_cov_33.203293_15_plen_180_part_00